MTLMYRARQGEITPEIARAAKDERVEPEKLRAQIAAGRAVICKNKVRRAIRPVPVGEGLPIKVNANIGSARDRADIAPRTREDARRRRGGRRRGHGPFHRRQDRRDPARGLGRVPRAAGDRSHLPGRGGRVHGRQVVGRAHRRRLLPGDREAGQGRRRLHDGPLRRDPLHDREAEARRAPPRHRQPRRLAAGGMDGVHDQENPFSSSTTGCWTSCANTTSRSRWATASAPAASRTRPTARRSTS